MHGTVWPVLFRPVMHFLGGYALHFITFTLWLPPKLRQNHKGTHNTMHRNPIVGKTIGMMN